MKFWKQLMTVVLALTLALSLSNGTANAASKKKKKKKEIKKEMMKEKKHEMAASKSVIEGANLAGKPGYFFADTAETLKQGQVMGAAHLTFDSWGSELQIPVGVSYGITKNLMINVNTAFFTADDVSGIYYLNFGGKYSFDVKTKGLGIAAGLDFSVGPLSNELGANTFGFDPYGVVTYTFTDGFQLNGKLGLYVQTYSIGPISGSWSFFQCDLGAAYPFDSNLTGIAELATNGVVNGGGLGGTPLLVGIRTGKDVQLQAFGGLDLGGEVGLFVGGGIALVSM